ncbi:hypothetical protein PA598K_03647 [Paenibacillus sp. 598K]|uniref:MerR family transcriptional regulator n=1 Tax=Paenibacillus sp. 598K TaxID=1117987 RepID=UPI000FFA1A2F|nr:MerR family transcriptional regulator [Paenibacillus sp. 598K]GBF75255.1 hypothetical protein PA598K_03647 [Paenibacillus sp. 598K]
MELTVGRFASAVHTTIRTLRYYEKIGLLVPGKKNDSNQKIYTRDELKKFYNIQLLKSMGWPLNEIKEMLGERAYSFKDMLAMQEAVLLEKRNKINASLAMMDRIKIVIHETGDLNNEDLMLLMNTIRLEEDQKTILKQYLSSNTVEKIMPKTKQQQIAFDRLNSRLLSFFQDAIHSGLHPDSQEVQQELKELLAIIPASINELFHSEMNLKKQSDLFKALLPVDMVEFFEEAMHVFYTNHKNEVKGD